MPFISFSYLIALDRTSSTILNRVNENRYFVIFLILEKAQYFTIEYDVTSGFFIYGFILLRMFPSFPSVLNILSWNCAEFCQMLFLQLRLSCGVFPFILLFFFFWPYSVACRISVPWPGTEPRSWQWKLCHVKQFILYAVESSLLSILLKIFASVAIWDIGLSFSFLILSSYNVFVWLLYPVMLVS